VVQVLKTHLPGVRAPELIFRTRCAAGMLNWLALAPVGRAQSKSEKTAERLLVRLSPARSAVPPPAEPPAGRHRLIISSNRLN